MINPSGTQCIPIIPQYGAAACYCQYPEGDNLARGTAPLDSLPAAWWNAMWHDNNVALACSRNLINNYGQELCNIIICSGGTLNENCNSQLYNTIFAVGTADKVGMVKSSTTNGQVSIASNGIMTVNGYGNAALQTTAQTLTGAINELKDAIDNFQGVTYSNTAPLVDGTAAAGTSDTAARGDHVHPIGCCLRADDYDYIKIAPGLILLRTNYNNCLATYTNWGKNELEATGCCACNYIHTCGCYGVNCINATGPYGCNTLYASGTCGYNCLRASQNILCATCYNYLTACARRNNSDTDCVINCLLACAPNDGVGDNCAYHAANILIACQTGQYGVANYNGSAGNILCAQGCNAYNCIVADTNARNYIIGKTTDIVDLNNHTQVWCDMSESSLNIGVSNRRAYYGSSDQRITTRYQLRASYICCDIGRLEISRTGSSAANSQAYFWSCFTRNQLTATGECGYNLLQATGCCGYNELYATGVHGRNYIGSNLGTNMLQAPLICMVGIACDAECAMPVEVNIQACTVHASCPTDICMIADRSNGYVRATHSMGTGEASAYNYITSDSIGVYLHSCLDTETNCRSGCIILDAADCSKLYASQMESVGHCIIHNVPLSSSSCPIWRSYCTRLITEYTPYTDTFENWAYCQLLGPVTSGNTDRLAYAEIDRGVLLAALYAQCVTYCYVCVSHTQTGSCYTEYQKGNGIANRYASGCYRDRIYLFTGLGMTHVCPGSTYQATGRTVICACEVAAFVQNVFGIPIYIPEA